MEGIELEARHETEFEDVGFMARAELDHNAKVSKLKAQWCVRSDEESTSTTMTSDLGFTTHSAWCGCATQ
eukprot:3013417-Rhodomonas_salina.1